MSLLAKYVPVLCKEGGYTMTGSGLRPDFMACVPDVATGGIRYMTIRNTLEMHYLGGQQYGW